MNKTELEKRPFNKLKHCKFEISSKTKLTNRIFDQLKDLNTTIFTDEQLSKMNTSNQSFQSSVAFEIYRKLATCWDQKLASALLCHLKSIPGNEDVIEFLQNCEESKKNLVRRRISIVTTKQETASEKVSHVINSDIFYYFNKKIGGSTSKVFQGYFKNERDWKAAVKKIDVDNSSQMFTNNYSLLVDRELEAWRKMSTEKSPGTSFIVSLLGIKEENGVYYLCMELASRNFRDEITLAILNPFIKEDRKTIITYLKNIAEGLNWLHEQRILHRNIKPENILIFEYKNGNVAKLSDFGVSRTISKSSGSLSEARGSPEWMAPEALVANQKDKSEDKIFKNNKMLDIFSSGLVFYFGLTGGEHPFSSYEGGILQNILEKDVRSKLLNQWASADHLLQWMMQKDPQKRPCILQVNQHPFFWSSKEQLQFCLKVTASASDKAKSSTWNLIKTNLNSAYRIYSKLHLNLTNAQLDWTKKVDQLFFLRKSQGGKKYEPFSFMSCLELIRDKHQHQGDMVPELFSKFTDSEGAFSDEIYAEYFFDRFPDLVGILFCTLAYIARNNLKSLGSLNDDYFKDFHDCANGWIGGADNISKYLNVYRMHERRRTNPINFHWESKNAKNETIVKDLKKLFG